MRIVDRRRRRRNFYLVGLIPSLLLLLVSGRIAVMLHQQGQAMSAYAAGDFESAREHFAANRVLNPIEPWIAPFGEGDARYRLEDFDGAVTAFEAASEVVPEERQCLVRVNLALAHEAAGDTLAEDDDRLEALDAWQEGRRVLRPCTELEKQRRVLRDRVDTDDADDTQARVLTTAVEVDERLADKLGIDEPVRTQEPDQAPPEDEETREKQRRLEEKNRQAHEDNVEHKDEFPDDPRPTPPAPSSAAPSPTPQW